MVYPWANACFSWKLVLEVRSACILASAGADFDQRLPEIADSSAAASNWRGIGATEERLWFDDHQPVSGDTTGEESDVR